MSTQERKPPEGAATLSAPLGDCGHAEAVVFNQRAAAPVATPVDRFHQTVKSIFTYGSQL